MDERVTALAIRLKYESIRTAELLRLVESLSELPDSTFNIWTDAGVDWLMIDRPKNGNRYPLRKHCGDGRQILTDQSTWVPALRSSLEFWISASVTTDDDETETITAIELAKDYEVAAQAIRRRLLRNLNPISTGRPGVAYRFNEKAARKLCDKAYDRK